MPRSPLRALAVLVLAPLLLGGSGGARPPARDPILFVHGWRGDRAQWVPMLRRFREDGWADAELYSWTYNSGQPNAVTAGQLARRIDQILAATRASRVDIVTHSMGALPSRYYLKALGGGDRVDAFVSLGGPNHGTSAAEICFSSACREMRIGSAFLAALNADDETPGDPRYATWWSPCDEVIDPHASVALDGAANHRTHCIYHLDFLTDPHVYRDVRDFISR